MNERATSALLREGVSIWLDDLSRERIVSGELEEMIRSFDVVGVTTNPTIFANAIRSGSGYADSLSERSREDLSVEEAVFELMCADVADACDVFAPLYTSSGGRDGRVSIEVSPLLANDSQGTIAQATELWSRVDRPNAMIKIPATPEGLEAISEVTALGISVNVTLIFSLTRYREVINAYLTGLERARRSGLDLTRIHSVASFFVSRVDTMIDAKLDEIGTAEARVIRGACGLANARLAYEVFTQGFASERARLLLDAGANLQRPLWASTGVKDPSLPDTLYVSGLVAPNVVNTMPEATLRAFADHGEVTGNTISAAASESEGVLNSLDAVGIDYRDITEQLEREGIEKFEASWAELLDTVGHEYLGTV